MGEAVGHNLFCVRHLVTSKKCCNVDEGGKGNNGDQATK